MVRRLGRSARGVRAYGSRSFRRRGLAEERPHLIRLPATLGCGQVAPYHYWIRQSKQKALSPHRRSHWPEVSPSVSPPPSEKQVFSSHLQLATRQKTSKF